MTFPYSMINTQNKENESESVKYGSRKAEKSLFSCDRNSKREGMLINDHNRKENIDVVSC